MYNSNNHTDIELGGTCYKQQEVKGRTVITIQYNLRELAKVYREAMRDDTLLRKLKQEYYGELLPKAQVGVDTPIPFNPFDEIKLALKHLGYYPSIKVQGCDLPPPRKSTATENDNTAEILEEMQNDAHESSNDSDSDYVASEEEDSDEESTSDDDSICDTVLEDEDVQDV